MLPLQSAIDRQKHVAVNALAAERVASRMIARLDGHKGPVISMSTDEYTEIGLSMVNLAGIAKEFHGLLAGAPTRDEIFALVGSTTEASRQLTDAIETLSTIAKRLNAEPRGEDIEGNPGVGRDA